MSKSKTFKCYGCWELGHKIPDCPNNNTKTKVVKAGPAKVLGRNEILATMGDISFPIILDTDTHMSVLPIEANRTVK